MSEAQREADIIRGQADARRNAVFAEAYGADEEFFEFYRSLDAYRAALSGNTSTMIMSPDSEFFSYLKSNNPSGGALSPAPATEAAASEEGTANEDGATSSDAGSEPSGQSADEGAEAPEAGNAGGAGNASTMPLDDSATE